MDITSRDIHIYWNILKKSLVGFKNPLVYPDNNLIALVADLNITDVSYHS